MLYDTAELGFHMLIQVYSLLLYHAYISIIATARNIQHLESL